MTNHWLHFANNTTAPGEYERRSGESFHIRLRRAGTSTVDDAGTTRVFDANAPACNVGRTPKFLDINGVIGKVYSFFFSSCLSFYFLCLLDAVRGSKKKKRDEYLGSDGRVIVMMNLS